MQATKAEKVRLGVFITLSLLILAAVLFHLVGKRLVTKEDIYYVKFEESVEGLLTASNVKLNGVVVGKVVDIFVDSADVRKIVVKFAVREGTPIKEDMVANLSGGISITGLKTIELTGGSNESPRLNPGSEIKAGVSKLKILTGQAEAIAIKFESLMNNLLNLTNEKNQDAVTNFLGGISSLAYQLDTLIQKNASTIKNALQHMDAAAVELKNTVARTDDLIQSIQNAKPGKRLGNTLEEFQQTSKLLNKRVADADIQGTLKEFQKAAKAFTRTSRDIGNILAVIQEDLGSVMSKTKETAENFEDFSRMIKDNPSLLLRSQEKEERR